MDLTLYANSIYMVILLIAKKDRATLGSDPSALVMPYGMGRGSSWASSSIICRRPKSDKSKLKSILSYQLFWS
jgi:hypothetical protein